jgi:hypothetical protein
VAAIPKGLDMQAYYKALTEKVLPYVGAVEVTESGFADRTGPGLIARPGNQQANLAAVVAQYPREAAEANRLTAGSSFTFKNVAVALGKVVGLTAVGAAGLIGASALFGAAGASGTILGGAGSAAVPAGAAVVPAGTVAVPVASTVVPAAAGSGIFSGVTAGGVISSVAKIAAPYAIKAALGPGPATTTAATSPTAPQLITGFTPGYGGSGGYGGGGGGMPPAMTAEGGVEASNLPLILLVGAIAILYMKK